MPEQHLRVLVVEDDPDSRELVKLMLSRGTDPTISTATASTLQEAVAAVLDDGPFDAAAVDLVLPDASGVDAVESIALHAPATAIVAITGEDETLALSVLAAGAGDFLEKAHLTPKALLRSLRFAVQRKQHELTIRELVEVDPLTGVANRRAVDHHWKVASDNLRRLGGQILLAMLDLDGFKAVNDDLGHPIGDLVLADVAHGLGQATRPSDLVARVGGDEFLVLSHDRTGAIEAHGFGQRLAAAVRSDAADRPITASVGVTSVTDLEVDLAMAITAADARLLEAKRRGGGVVPRHEPQPAAAHT